MSDSFSEYSASVDSSWIPSFSSEALNSLESDFFAASFSHIVVSEISLFIFDSEQKFDLFEELSKNICLHFVSFWF